MLNVIKACQKKIVVLQHIFLEIYIKRDYPLRVFFYEKKIHRQSQRILRAISRLYPSTAYEALSKQYDLTLAVGQLRYRVKDYSTFSIIEPELKALKKGSPNAISALETIYANTLSVAAADPLLFLLWMDALKELNHEA